MSQRGVVAALTLLAIVFAAGIVHVASLLILPRVAPDDAFARLAAATPENGVSVLPRAGSPGAVLPGGDPSVASAVCRYDLDRGPLRVVAPVDGEAFTAMTLHSRSGVAFYGLNDRSRIDDRLEIVVMTARQLEAAKDRDAADAPVRDVRVVAPEPRGFVRVDVLPRVGGDAEARRALSAVSCRVERPS